MVSWIISRLVVLIFGTLYPAYYSYKAVKSKDIKEYVKWMMYWIIFALFTTAETFTDIFLCWFPFYYELKIAFVAWLLSPYTKGSSLLYRKFVHPTLSSKEKEIDDCLVQAKDRSYDALVHFGKRGLNVAATAAVMAASKGQGALSERLRSFSMQDLTTIRGDGAPAPSGPPPPGTGRSSGKHGQPKMSRSASESAGSSVCTCCSSCRTRKVVEGDVNEGGVKSWEPHQVQSPLAFSDEEEEDLLEFMYKYKAPRRTELPLEAPPRILRSRFRKKSTSSLATETTDQCRGRFLQEEEPTSEHLVLENTKQRGEAGTRLCFRCAPKPRAAHRTTRRQDLGRTEAEVHRQPWLLPPPGLCEDEPGGLTLALTPCRCGCFTQARTEGRT